MGHLRVLADRNHDLKYAEGKTSAPFGHANLEIALAEQNVWGYGQVITLAILILPFISFFEFLYGILWTLVMMSRFLPPKKQLKSNVYFCTETMTVLETPRLQVDILYSLHETLYGPSQSYEDFYKYPWFHKIHLLMYLLPLTIIGDILYFIAQNSTAIYTQPLFPFIRKYTLWIGFNVALVWIYTLLCVELLKTVEAKRMEEWQSMEEAQDIEELLSLNWIRYFNTGLKPLRMFISRLVWYGVGFCWLFK